MRHLPPVPSGPLQGGEIAHRVGFFFFLSSSSGPPVHQSLNKCLPSTVLQALNYMQRHKGEQSCEIIFDGAPFLPCVTMLAILVLVPAFLGSHL